MGFEVTPGIKSYSWFKLRLDPAARIDDSESGISVSEGPGLLRLPHGKTAREVCADFLREIYHEFHAQLVRSLGQGVVDVSRKEFWFTVPAIWSDQAKAHTRAAALDAGFGSGEEDEIFLISEPEAAAVASLSRLGDNARDQIRVGEGILVCDCGGGTVDITTYHLTQVTPALKFEELLVGEGDFCGSTYLDRAFHTWMSRTFGSDFDDLPFEKKAPGSKFMKEFEMSKIDFGYGTQQEYNISLTMRNASDGPFYDAAEATVKLPKRDMESFFTTVVKKILALLERQLRAAKMQTNREISKIILCGGFGDSQYLYDAIRKWAREHGNNATVMCPEYPQAAIVLGAALRGLGGVKPSSRKCRRHYGFQLDLPYDSDLDEKQHCYKDNYDHTRRARGTMVWKIALGDTITEDSFISQGVLKPYYKGEQRVYEVGLYATSAEHAPRRVEHPRVTRVGVIRVDLTHVSLSRFHRKWKVSQDRFIYQLQYDLQIMLGRSEGVLLVRAMNGEDVVGTAQIDYSR